MMPALYRFSIVACAALSLVTAGQNTGDVRAQSPAARTVSRPRSTTAAQPAQRSAPSVRRAQFDAPPPADIEAGPLPLPFGEDVSGSLPSDVSGVVPTEIPLGEPLPAEETLPLPDQVVAPPVEVLPLPAPVGQSLDAVVAPGAHGPAFLTVVRRDLNFPDDTEHPRRSMIEVHVPAGARAYRNSKNMEGGNGIFRYAPQEELLPGVPYLQHIRVDVPVDGGVISRTCSVYMRMGISTELTFSP